MPMVLAASTMSVPAGTAILCPSMVRLTSGMGGLLPIYGEVAAGGRRRGCPNFALVPQGMVLVFLTEVAERRVDDPARGVAQAAQAAPVLETVRHALQRVELDLRPLIGQDPLVRAHRPVAADPARRAFAA